MAKNSGVAPGCLHPFTGRGPTSQAIPHRRSAVDFLEHRLPWSGAGDAYVARLNAALTEHFQSTYLGGAGLDFTWALAAHPQSGDLYITVTPTRRPSRRLRPRSKRHPAAATMRSSPVSIPH
jgi:hypothetical protein